MKQTLILNYIPTTLNKYINYERTNKFIAASIKKKETNMVIIECKAQGLKPIYGKVKIHFYWYVKNKRSDPDNIAFGKKYILDGLQKAGIIKNDNLNTITELRDYFVIDKTEQVIVDIIKV